MAPVEGLGMEAGRASRAPVGLPSAPSEHWAMRCETRRPSPPRPPKQAHPWARSSQRTHHHRRPRGSRRPSHTRRTHAPRTPRQRLRRTRGCFGCGAVAAAAGTGRRGSARGARAPSCLGEPSPLESPGARGRRSARCPQRAWRPSQTSAGGPTRSHSTPRRPRESTRPAPQRPGWAPTASTRGPQPGKACGILRVWTAIWAAGARPARATRRPRHSVRPPPPEDRGTHRPTHKDPARPRGQRGARSPPTAAGNRPR
mmetsp:Transcript_6044/g.18002  ORF Transcript_6044/g.18002 Transcript_6044/m.18002 type:complete len:257 (-) Transcript_6044:834-1604(-)